MHTPAFCMNFRFRWKWGDRLKKALISVFSILIILLFFLISFTLHGRNLRQTELDNALTVSMKQAMDVLQADKGKPASEEEWKMIFLQSLAGQIESESDLTVNILEIDMEKGILSAEAVLKYTHPIGTKGSVSVRRTAILEEYTFK